MYKNAASQVFEFEERDYTTGAPKTGDSANIAVYESIDGANTVAIAGAVVEVDATHMPGWYRVPLAAGETNGNSILFGAKSSTANTVCFGRVMITNIDANRPRVDGH